MMDQAGTLRRIMNGRVPLRVYNAKPFRVISVTSGKGGVGKTSIVANLAVLLSRAGHRVLVLDGDFGLANLNIVLGLNAKVNIQHVLSGEKRLQDIILTGPAGIQVIPASSGIFKMADMGMAEKSIIMDQLESLPMSFDILLIDTGAGIHSDVAYLNAAATEILVIATPEPTSIADAYALMKVMNQEYKVKRFKLLVNRVQDAREAMSVHHQLLHVSDQFLNIQIEYVGHIVEDREMGKAVMQRKVVCTSGVASPARHCLEAAAKALDEAPFRSELTGNVQFFWRTLLQEVAL